MKVLHDACSSLTTVCDEDVTAAVTQQVHEIDERWQGVQRALADQSEYQYDASVQHISRWCDSVETELCRHIKADYDELKAQNSSLEVSLFIVLSYICAMTEMNFCLSAVGMVHYLLGDCIFCTAYFGHYLRVML